MKHNDPNLQKDSPANQRINAATRDERNNEKVRNPTVVDPEPEATVAPGVVLQVEVYIPEPDSDSKQKLRVTTSSFACGSGFGLRQLLVFFESSFKKRLTVNVLPSHEMILEPPFEKGLHTPTFLMSGFGCGLVARAPVQLGPA
jgi:hypothetical protein